MPEESKVEERHIQEGENAYMLSCENVQHGHPETWSFSKTDMINRAKYNSCLISTVADLLYITSTLHGFLVVRISVFYWYFIALYEFILCSFVIVCYLGLPETLIILEMLLWAFRCVNMQNRFSRIMFIE